MTIEIELKPCYCLHSLHMLQAMTHTNHDICHRLSTYSLVSLSNCFVSGMIFSRVEYFCFVFVFVPKIGRIGQFTCVKALYPFWSFCARCNGSFLSKLADNSKTIPSFGYLTHSSASSFNVFGASRPLGLPDYPN